MGRKDLIMNETIVTATENVPEMNNATAVETVTVESPASVNDTIMGIGVDTLQKVGLFGLGALVGIGLAKGHQAYKDYKRGKAQREAAKKDAAMKETAKKVVEEVVEAKAEAKAEPKAEPKAEAPAEESK